MLTMTPSFLPVRKNVTISSDPLVLIFEHHGAYVFCAESELCLFFNEKYFFSEKCVFWEKMHFKKYQKMVLMAEFGRVQWCLHRGYNNVCTCGSFRKYIEICVLVRFSHGASTNRHSRRRIHPIELASRKFLSTTSNQCSGISYEKIWLVRDYFDKNDKINCKSWLVLFLDHK